MDWLDLQCTADTKRHGSGDSTPFLNQEHEAVCTQRGAELDHEAFEAKADLFRRFTTKQVTHDKQRECKNISHLISSLSYDTCVETYCEFA